VGQQQVMQLSDWFFNASGSHATYDSVATKEVSMTVGPVCACAGHPAKRTESPQDLPDFPTFHASFIIARQEPFMPFE
jgi:hypothetical protein